MQPETNPVNSAPKSPKAPIIVIVIAWLLLLSGLFQLVASRFLGLMDINLLLQNPLLILTNLITILWIIVAIGLRKMKKWALYLLLLSTIFSIIDGVVAYLNTSEIFNIQALAITLIISAYFVYIRDKFV